MMTSSLDMLVWNYNLGGDVLFCNDQAFQATKIAGLSTLNLLNSRLNARPLDSILIPKTKNGFD